MSGVVENVVTGRRHDVAEEWDSGDVVTVCGAVLAEDTVTPSLWSVSCPRCLAASRGAVSAA